MRTGLDRLLEEPAALTGRRFAVLSHSAATSSALEPILPALMRRHLEPRAVFAPEHGFYGVEQDMVAAHDQRDPATSLPIRSLYGDDESSLRPSPDAFADLDLLLVDLVDIGSRYYTYAATAVWASEAALAAGVEVLVLDRPNPLGGVAVEGPLVQPGFESFVGAFQMPVRHGLTLAEIVRFEARRGGWAAPGLRVLEVEGWRGEGLWQSPRPFFRAPSPNMPSLDAALIYPGGCLFEATQLSEGRGTTRPFQLVGAPGLDGALLARRLNALDLPGLRYLATEFRPQFQKHAGRRCGGVEIVVTDPSALRSLRSGVELLRAVYELAEDFAWRDAPYEFVDDIPAIDLLGGSTRLRQGLAAGSLDDWIGGWAADEQTFRQRREPILLYERAS